MSVVYSKTRYTAMLLNFKAGQWLVPGFSPRRYGITDFSRLSVNICHENPPLVHASAYFSHFSVYFSHFSKPRLSVTVRMTTLGKFHPRLELYSLSQLFNFTTDQPDIALNRPATVCTVDCTVQVFCLLDSAL